MGAQAAFVLGLLLGIILYWFIYRIYWRRWRATMDRDLAYLQGKVKSTLYTNFSLERQLNTQKGDLSELRGKINDLERENRQAHARLVEASDEKEALVSHLELLRTELAIFKKMAAQPPVPAAAPPRPTNGKAHEPEQALIPENGAAGNKIKEPKQPPSNGKTKTILFPEPVIEPVMVISRPRMDGDRLEIIQGIGPAIVKKLRQEGIDSFLALSKMTPDELKKVVGARAAKLMDAENVIEQARRLVRERRP